MSLFKPTELREFLRQQGIRPDRTLSQNFLIDGNIIGKIVTEAKIEPGDVVLEIGPGPGALSQQLLRAGAQLVAVEMDTQLAAALNRLEADAATGGGLSVYESDILKFPIQEELQKRLAKGKRAKVVANLPYHLTTPILQRLIPLHDLISDVVVMVQHEVAQRMVEKPHTRAYNSLALFLDFYSSVSYAFKVGRKCFYPAPNVDSAIAHLTLHPPCEVTDIDDFFTLTRSAFGQRRKMLRRSLKDLHSSEAVEAQLEKLGYKATARPEELSLEAFIRLYEALSDKS